MIREQLATRLRQFRELSGMTIYEVGDKIGKSGKTVSAWENGRGQPDADMLLTLCEIYNIKSIGELYGQATVDVSLSSTETALLEAFRGFNLEGQEKVLSYVSDIESSGQYKKDNKYSLVEEAQ